MSYLELFFYVEIMFAVVCTAAAGMAAYTVILLIRRKDIGSP
jgi:hypothetical protein